MARQGHAIQDALAGFARHDWIDACEAASLKAAKKAEFYAPIWP